MISSPKFLRVELTTHVGSVGGMLSRDGVAGKHVNDQAQTCPRCARAWHPAHRTWLFHIGQLHSHRNTEQANDKCDHVHFGAGTKPNGAHCGGECPN